MEEINLTNKNHIHISQFEQFLNNHKIIKKPISWLELLYENHRSVNGYFKRSIHDPLYFSYFVHHFPELDLTNKFNGERLFLEIRDSKGNEILCRTLYEWMGVVLYIYQNIYSMNQLIDIQDTISEEVYNELINYPIHEINNTLNLNIVVTGESGHIEATKFIRNMSFYDITSVITADVSRGLFHPQKVTAIINRDCHTTYMINKEKRINNKNQ